MKKYAKYLDFLESLLKKSSKSQVFPTKDVDAALDGQASAKLRELIHLRQLRKSGAFFTGGNLAKKLIKEAHQHKQPHDIVLDPSCGAGGLLLETAQNFPIERTVSKTLTLWGMQLAGIDRHEEFVHATRLRLALLAAYRGAKIDVYKKSELEDLLPMLQIGDSLRENPIFSKADLILMNPPYGLKRTNKKCKWAKGNVTAASLFVENAINCSKPNTIFSVILPDVLRSGSRYNRWRDFIQENCRQVKISPQGRFDQFTDIDVFFMTLKKSNKGRKNNTKWWPKNQNGSSNRVDDLFDVCVGPVVPFRDPEKGALSPYIHARNLSPWDRVDNIDEKRRYSGRLIHPPFVAIRRTSRPDDEYRVVGTIVTGRNPIAVENHLIICRPKNNTIKHCKELLSRFKTEHCNEWFNKRICCRHLTVKAISEFTIVCG